MEDLEVAEVVNGRTKELLSELGREWEWEWVRELLIQLGIGIGIGVEIERFETEVDICLDSF